MKKHKYAKMFLTELETMPNILSLINDGRYKRQTILGSKRLSLKPSRKYVLYARKSTEDSSEKQGSINRLSSKGDVIDCRA
jgi:hypothetical protein